MNLRTGLPPVVITTVSMGIGGLLLLAVGAAAQGFGALDLRQWLIIAWLAVVNTALAFTLWNNTLRTLTAIESSVINNTMLPQIAILAWIFLGESLACQADPGPGAGGSRDIDRAADAAWRQIRLDQGFKIE